jgi:hypothetical protein
MEELEYTIKMNKRAILARLERVQKAMAELQSLIETENWHGSDSATWVDGHAAEEMAAMSSLIARQRALVDVLRILKKGN